MDTYTQSDILRFDNVLASFEDIETAKNLVNARSRAVKLTVSLFPEFTDEPNLDELLNDYNLEQYGYFRALGLSVTDTAYSMRMSAKKLKSLLTGRGVTLERFVELIKQELFARAECKARLLRDIEQSTNTKNWRTSLTLLEKLYPEEFGPKATIEEKLGQLVADKWTINIVESTKEKG